MLPGFSWPAGGVELPRRLIQFDIPAQPLAEAISTFSAVAGIEVLVPGELLARRQSMGVTGALTPEAALRALLSSTDLVPRGMGDGALTLERESPLPAFPGGRIPQYPQYSAALQGVVIDVLCRLALIKPGGHRIAVRLWVRRSGEITHTDLLGTTGDPDRDRILAQLLKHVVVPEPPPAQLPQPTTLLVLPRPEPRCTSVAGYAP
jgi:hypothetical protein